jgi:DHA2 family multidrug resistance protein
VLARGAQVHQAMLVSHMTPYDAAFQERLHQMQSAFASQAGAAQATEQAYGVMYRMVVKQSSLLAFLDGFWILTLLCLLCIPLIFLFKNVKSKAGAEIAAH